VTQTSVSSGHRSAEEIGRTEFGPRELPAIGGLGTAPELEHVDTVLANGLRVLAVRKANVPMVETRLSIPFGGDSPEHTATAEVLAETILTGTGRRDRVGIDTELSLIGGELNTVVDPERLAIAGGCLTTGLSTLLDVLADALGNASHPDDEVQRESARLMERLAVARTQPRVLAREALQHRRYGNHPAAREVPKGEYVAEVSAADVRALHARSVLPSGSTLVVVGDVDPQTAVSQVETTLGGWSGTGAAAELASLPEVHGNDILLVERPGAVQSQIRLSAQALPRTDTRYPALQMANLAFGGFFSSRLVENIREDKGYTYGARSGFEFTPNGATVQVDADTANEVTAAALLETRYELGKLAVVPPSEAEVEAARQYAIGSLLITTSSQAGLAGQLSALAQVGLGVDWLTGHPERLAAVTREDVARVALDFFAPARFTGVVVGDADSLAPQLNALGGVARE